MESYLLEDGYRKKLLQAAIEQSGSKYSPAMALGYSSVGAGKMINSWYEGRSKIPLERLEKLSAIVNIPLDEILRHQEGGRSSTRANGR